MTDDSRGKERDEKTEGPEDGGRARLVNPLVGSLMACSAMMILNASMVTAALPSIRDTFALDVGLVAWLSTAYNLPYVIGMSLFGRLGDGLRRPRLLLIGISLFLIGTSLNLFPGGFDLLLVGRSIQGMGAAAVLPISLALISDRMSANVRGKAMGTWTSTGPSAYVVGPLIAGALIELITWRSIFVPVLAAAAAAFVAVRTGIPSRRDAPSRDFLRTFDWQGAGMLGATVASVLFYLFSEQITGVRTLRDWRFLLVSPILFGLFLLWERRREDPFVALELFRQKSFKRGSLCGALRMFILSMTFFVTPLYLADVRVMRPGLIGVMLPLHAIAQAILTRVGGWWADRSGSRRPVLLGLSSHAAAMVYFALLPASAPPILVVLGLLLTGTAAGFSLAPLHRAAMSDVQRRYSGMAAGLYSMFRFGGFAFGTAINGVLLNKGLDRGLAVESAYQLVFWFDAAVAVLAALVGATL